MYFCAWIELYSMQQTAIIAGASGLTGGILLQQLLLQPQYGLVVALVRKPLAVTHSKLQQVVVDFEQPEQWQHYLTGEALFCCLGSTRKKTPDLKDYYRIDYDYPLLLAKLAASNELKQFHLLSALGANAQSANFYSKLKGQTEDEIKQSGIPSIHIYQPSVLVGNRAENRPGERFFIALMRLLNPLLLGKLTKYRSIAAAKVAAYMCAQSLNFKPGIHIHPSNTINN